MNLSMLDCNMEPNRCLFSSFRKEDTSRISAVDCLLVGFMDSISAD